MSPDVSVTLSSDEALVLFDFLSRYSDTERLETIDQAEERALWNLSSLLEKSLVEPFDPAYAELLTAARERFRDSS